MEICVKCWMATIIIHRLLNFELTISKITPAIHGGHRHEPNLPGTIENAEAAAYLKMANFLEKTGKKIWNRD